MAARLIVPDGLIIDAAAVRRLHGTLDRVAPDVAGVLAAVDPLPPGSSYRVHAERCTLIPRDQVVPAAPGSPGAVLVREGVEASLTGSSVAVPAGLVLLDPGAVCHDPDAPTAEPAGPAERPPFPWRPVVAFVAEGRIGSATAGWLAELVDALLDHDVEARVAAPLGVPSRLTSPFAAGPDAVVDLAPDIVVTLDDPSTARWSADASLPRSTVVVSCSGAAGGVDLVSWTVGAASGRCRAVIGVDTGPAELAEMCARLVAGPPPAAPPVTWDAEVAVAIAGEAEGGDRDD